MKPIEQVQREHEGEWLGLPGVEAVGIAECEGKPCMKIYVTDSSVHLDAIPARIEGHPVRIEISGTIRALNTGDSTR